MKASIILISVVLAVASCTRAEGPVVDETRSIGPLNRIDAGAGVQVRVTIGPAGPIVVHAQQSVQDKVATVVRDGTLQIEATEDFVVNDAVVVDVQVPSLDGIVLSGGASIDVRGLTVASLDVGLSGGARATIAGSTEMLRLSVKGGSVASLAGLTTATVSVDLDGGANAEILATGSVAGTASGGATLRVTGGASVDVSTSGGAVVSEG
jgi:hypothetical protein